MTSKGFDAFLMALLFYLVCIDFILLRPQPWADLRDGSIFAGFMILIICNLYCEGRSI